LQDSCAYIGKTNTFRVSLPAARVSCFANDNTYMYWNNLGALNVGVFLLK
jgi:hypothetical protein